MPTHLVQQRLKAEECHLRLRNQVNEGREEIDLRKMSEELWRQQWRTIAGFDNISELV